MTQRVALATLPVLLVAALLAVAPPAVGQPPAGTYRARPAEILACGGFIGDCRALTLDGTLDLAIAVPDGGGFAVVQVAESDLRLRAADGTGGVFVFPAVDDVQLTELTDDPETGELVLRGPEGAPQTVTLRLTQTSPSTVVLEGTYDEGCCDRFVYELGTVLLEHQGGAADDALVLGEGDFSIEVDWGDFQLGSGSGTPVKFNERSGAFWFFNPANPELLVKVLDGCAVNGHYWFFAAGLTNVDVEIRVTDGTAPLTRTYENPLRRDFEPILDTTAFPCTPST